MIDYQKIIDGLQPEKIKQLLYKLGAEQVIEKENHFITNTICHNSDGGSLKLYYYFDSHLFVCYTEDGTMNIFKFLETYYESRQILYNWYQDVFKIVEQCSSCGTASFDLSFAGEQYQTVADNYKAKVPKKLPAFNENVLDVFTKYYPPEWLNDGISKQSMDKFNILYSISQNKIVIPHYDAHNRLVGIRGRALNKWEVENLGKYMPIQIEGVWYSHPLSLNLYGLNETKNYIKRSGICFLGEAEKFVLQCDSMGIKEAVAVCGSSINRYQIQILMQTARPREIVVCFDNEEEKGQVNYFYKLYKLCKKYTNYCNMSFIYDRDRLTKKKDSPTDEGKEIFKKLVEGRVMVR